MNKIYTLTIILLSLFGNELKSQDYYILLSRDFYDRYEPYMYQLKSEVHTSIRPLRSSELRPYMPFDSIGSNTSIKNSKFQNKWVGRKLYKEHFLQKKGEDFNLYIDPYIDFSAGYDLKDDKSTYTNMRGIWVSGNIGERFSFSSTFAENQAQFPSFIDSVITLYKVVPGQGRTKKLYGDRDFAFATGTISYSLKKHFNFQFGHDKNFIGDGYRSLLLSDYAFNYPHLKINCDVWKVKYMFMLAAFQDILIGPPPNYDPEDFSFRKKWGSFHYFDFNIGKRASIGILEGVIWKSDSVRAKAIDINYFNPFVFFRPVEFSLSSPDNAMLGLNLKFKLSSATTLYSQVMIDDFKIEEVRAGKGWYGNKQAIQFGVKSFNLFHVKNLHAQTEINYVRPFTYAHRTSLTNYGHYNEPLAHPLRSDFLESVSIVRYSYRNFYSRLQFMYYVAGADTGGLNYGNNILLSYNTKANEYGNYVTNGLKNTITYTELNLGYLFNPSNNLKAEITIVNRKQQSDRGTLESFWISFGIKTSLANKIYDF